MNGLESPIFQPDTPGSHTRNPPETTTPNQIITLLVDLVYPLFGYPNGLAEGLKGPLGGPTGGPRGLTSGPPIFLPKGPVGIPSGPLSTLEASWAR